MNKTKQGNKWKHFFHFLCNFVFKAIQDDAIVQFQESFTHGRTRKECPKTNSINFASVRPSVPCISVYKLQQSSALLTYYNVNVYSSYLLTYLLTQLFTYNEEQGTKQDGFHSDVQVHWN